MTLRETRDLAASIVREHNDLLNVTGVMPQRGSSRAEVLVEGDASPGHPCRLLLGSDRSTPEAFALSLQRALVRALTRTARPES